MTKPNLVIFICADESTNAGERDYMKGIAAEIQARGMREDTEYRVYKKSPADETKKKGGDPFVLPVTDEQYAAVPHLNELELDNRFYATTPLQSIKIVGVGHSTLDDTLLVWGGARLSRIPVCGTHSAPLKDIISASYITRGVDEGMLEKVFERGINALLTPIAPGAVSAAGVDKIIVSLGLAKTAPPAQKPVSTPGLRG